MHKQCADEAGRLASEEAEAAMAMALETRRTAGSTSPSDEFTSASPRWEEEGEEIEGAQGDRNSKSGKNRLSKHLRRGSSQTSLDSRSSAAPSPGPMLSLHLDSGSAWEESRTSDGKVCACLPTLFDWLSG